MKRFVGSPVAALFVALLVFAATVSASMLGGNNQTRTVRYSAWTIDTLSTDTLYFSLPAAEGYGGGNEAAASLTSINPPDQVQFSGNLSYTINVVSGTYDSTAAKVKPLDHTGSVVINDSTWLFGVDTTAATNAISANVRTFNATGQFDPSAHGFALIVYNRDTLNLVLNVAQHSN